MDLGKSSASQHCIYMKHVSGEHGCYGAFWGHADCVVLQWGSSLAERGVHSVVIFGSMSGRRCSIVDLTSNSLTVAKCFAVYL